MEIRPKLYPYPVLSYYSDDYVDSSFDTVITPVRDGYNIRIDFLAEVNNAGISDLLVSGKAKIVYHLECAQTGYRVAVSTSKYELSHVIVNKMISGRLQVCPFIVAEMEIAEYVNPNFHEDYRGFKFTIEEGCVMAVGKQVNINVDKEISDLSDTPSVFSIIKNDDELVLGMVVDLDYKKIVIKLPEREFFNFKSLKGQALIQSVLNSLVVIPALTYVLEEVSKREPSERYEYSSYAWYRTIKKSLANKFSCDIDSEKFTDRNMLETAQKLINVPLSDALQTLSSGYGNTGEEEDE
ncbi:hypothetical protein [Pectinatus haikarae]|uniref:Uncharacterized protein n=1 Tax=Pectinatus haikarae TaxID=349096 RepID=A0ABT9Y8Q7_9FIRM|nr:hypothetical protein [Pectinatus haikarae]MDQ0204129.1 hypothetical protein [Pectinatus haikarae]